MIRKQVTVDALTSSARAKLDRADEHFDALNRYIDWWGDQDPFTVRRESNADGSEHIFTLHLDPAKPPDFWRWAAMFSDALHNLRCALDHTVFALAAAQTKKFPPDDEAKLAFPICSEPKYFRGQRHRIASLNSATQAAIERLQPYNRLRPGRWFAPLWYLAQLHDIDKHRQLQLAATAARADDLAINATPGTFRALWNSGQLEDGAPILRLLLDEPDPNVYVDLSAKAAIVLDLGMGEPSSIYWTGRHIRREVHVTCRYLWQFFAT